MKNEIAFLAIGQAGGNIGKLFEAENYKVMYINTSQEDLKTIQNPKYAYHIAKGEGAAKNRGRAFELLSADLENLKVEISNTITEEYVFVIFSAGGGTGSGCAPALLACLSVILPKRKIGAITILPSIDETLQAQINAYECFSDITKAENLGAMFVLDNNGKGDKMALNTVFVDLFGQILRIPDYVDDRGNIDVKELKEVLSSPGCIVVSTLPSSLSSTPKLLESFKDGIFAPTEQDEIVKYIALSMASEINTTALCRVTGKPLDIYRGYNAETTICVLSGLSLPYSRLAGIKTKIIQEQEAMKKIWLVKKQELSAGSVDLGFMGSADKPDAAQGTTDDIMAKFKRR